ncbi:hypothetical protein [Candidimonas nitroreducens]|uniref:Uncharacterized protein n=1 Tax=Candidimonas nitroreducens TaxID=683354 RepID=A0A225MJ40_9BURK|nr:hypothetical protein [Candidimonas nitroreducens]OWT60343.1 hypothetical protein CEY11_11915 [Candidimonas nitroreducens]
MLLAGCGGCDIMDPSASDSLACMPALAAAIVALPVRPLMDAHEQQEFKSRRPVWHLAAAQKFGELELPAGTTVYLYLNAPEDRTRVTQESMDEIQLPASGMTWRGTKLYGHMLRAEYEQTYWLVRLTENQPVQGWPCARGAATLWNDGNLRGCRLATDHRVSGKLETEPGATVHTLQAGSEILVFADALKYTTDGGRQQRLEHWSHDPQP